LLDVERFKDEKFGFYRARDEYLWIVEFNFVAWFGLEVVTDFGFGAQIDIHLDVS